VRIVYVGVPRAYVDQVDGVMAYLARQPGLAASGISVPALAALDLTYQTLNPPDDLIWFWVRERRRRDSNYWLRALLAHAAGVARRKEAPLVLVVAAPEDDPRLADLLDVVYRGDMSQLLADISRLMRDNDNGT